MGEQEFKRTTVIEGNKINTRNVNRRKGNKINTRNVNRRKGNKIIFF